MPQLGLRGRRALPSEVRALIAVAVKVAMGLGLVAPATPLAGGRQGEAGDKCCAEQELGSHD